MKLSEAMREGATKSQPGVVDLTSRDSQHNLYACALGAAHIGNGGNPDMLDSDIWNSLRQIWPELKAVRMLRKCQDQEDLEIEDDLEGIIWYHNDILEWTREDNAAWLERLGY